MTILYVGAGLCLVLAWCFRREAPQPYQLPGWIWLLLTALAMVIAAVVIPLT